METAIVFDMDSAVALALSANSADKAAATTRDKLCAFFVDQGVKPNDMKAPRNGSNAPHWANLKGMAARVVKLKEKRLEGQDLADYLDDTVGPKKIIAGTQKGGTGTSWNGSVTSQISNWRKWLTEYVNRGNSPETRVVKNDHDYLVAKGGEMLKRIAKVLQAENPDGSLSQEHAAGLQHDLTKVLAAYGLDK